MSYQAPQVSTAGLSIPSYSDILELLLLQFKSIYGQTVYLGPDSPDYQWASVVALALSDGMQGIQLAYNNHSPSFAIGASLDILVKLNGIIRKLATFSLCSLTLTGTPGITINNGIAIDVNGNKWDLPSVVIIGGGGATIVTATCETPGAINALVGQINAIFTPTAGWTSVTNAAPAVVGQPIETDAQLRARQALSVELPSETLLAGTVAAIAATAGVTRYKVLENFTGATDAFGNPGHSVTAVVEGGTDLAVATAIYNNRGIGPFTNPTTTAGATTVNITDPNTGIITPIGFSRPTYIPIFVIINARLLSGGTTATIAAMQAAVTTYLNALQIGETVSFSALIAIAMDINPDLKNPIILVESIFLDIVPTPTSPTDITMNFYQVAQANTITVNSI
jgi:uncharacterized phage protein gp47/JayE